MNDPEQQFFAWAGRVIAGGFVGCLAWLWTWMWTRVHKTLPAKLESLERRLDDYATTAEVEHMEQQFRESLQQQGTQFREALREQGDQFRIALREQSDQRKEMHGENGRRVDTVIDEIRALRDDVKTGLREAHARIDDHIDRAHSK